MGETQMPVLEKPKVIFVLGAPGSGKGTQCANIVSQYNYVHLSAGDLLRAERNRPGSELAQTIEEFIRGGKIIPVAVTCSLIERAMNEQMKVSFGWNFLWKLWKFESMTKQCDDLKYGILCDDTRRAYWSGNIIIFVKMLLSATTLNEKSIANDFTHFSKKELTFRRKSLFKVNFS